jgi:intracellular sulfur oxidation DsrE/DsrF family protein
MLKFVTHQGIVKELEISRFFLLEEQGVRLRACGQSKRGRSISRKQTESSIQYVLASIQFIAANLKCKDI